MKKTNHILFTIVFILSSIFSNLSYQTAKSVQASPINTQTQKKTFKLQKGVSYKPDKIAVKYKSSSTETSFKKKFKQYNTSEIKKYQRSNVSVLQVPKGKNVEQYINELINDPDVAYIQPVYQYKRKTAPNDVYYGNQWYLNKIQALNAWDISKGTSIKVAVIDGAVDITHEDLSSNIAGTYSTVTGVTGYDEHATHVAGIIAGTINNSKGIAGIAPLAKILSINVFYGDYTDDLEVAEGIRYAADNGARIINMSLGGPGESYALEEAVNYAYSKGAVLVAAAGNENTLLPSYPAAYENVISVSATNQSDIITDFSNYGDTIDIAAPGENIYSTITGNNYAYMAGTSMASPVVAGVAALILAKNPSLTNLQVRNILLNSAVDIGNDGRDNYYGYGRVDAYRALSTNLPNDSLEENNTFSSAKTINPDIFVQAFINPEGDQDYYKFALSTAQYVKIKAVPPYDLDLVVSLYDQNQNLIVEADDALRGEGEELERYLAAGNYYIKLNDYFSNSSLSYYTLMVELLKPPAINSLIIQPNPFILTGTSSTAINYNLSQNCNVNIKILNSSGQLIKQLASSKAAVSGNNTIAWDGKDSTGKYVVQGSYKVQIEAVGVYGTSLREAVFTVTDKILPLISGISALGYFAPKGTNTWKLSYNLSEPSKTTVVIKDSLGRDIRTLISGASQAAGVNSVTWDGKNSSGTIVPNGSYSYRVTFTDLYGNYGTAYQGTVIVDTLIPVVSQITDTPDPFLPTGTNLSTITFNLSEKSKVNLKIYSPNGALFMDLLSNKELAASINKVTWNGKDKYGKFGADGYYKYSITAVDFAGNTSVSQAGQIRVDANVPTITSISDTPDAAAPNGTNYSTIYYTLSEAAKVTIGIYNSSGVLQKTLLSNTTVNAGSQKITWNFRNSSNVLVPDGVYTYKISAVDSFNKRSIVYQGTITLDRVKPVISLTSPLAVQYSFTGSNTNNFNFSISENAKVTLRLIKADGTTARYLLNNWGKGKGANSVCWDGKDQSGNTLLNGTYKFQLYAIDYAGTKSNVISGTISYRDLWTPALSSDNTYYISSNVSTTVTIPYTLPKNAYATIDILNSSGTVVKNVITNTLLSKGANSFTWNGRNSSNVMLANGTYNYRIRAKDINGNILPVLSGKIILDNSAPVTTNVSVATSSYPVKADIKFTISETLQVTIIVYKKNDTIPIPIIIKDQNMSPGSYVIPWSNYNYYDSYNYSIIVRDKSGNTGVKVGSF